MSRTPNRSLPQATPVLAKAAWMRQRRPSARTVATALTQAGRPVHFTTVARWRAQGWRAVEGKHPLDGARDTLDSAAPLITGDPQNTAAKFVEESPDSAGLEKLKDDEIL